MSPPSFRVLSCVDLLGVTYTASTIATGYGAYIAQPLLRKEVEGREMTLSKDEAEHILETCMRVLFYRDARSLDKASRPSLISHRDVDIINTVPNCNYYQRGRGDFGGTKARYVVELRRGHQRLWFSNSVMYEIVASSSLDILVHPKRSLFDKTLKKIIPKNSLLHRRSELIRQPGNPCAIL